MQGIGMRSAPSGSIIRTDPVKAAAEDADYRRLFPYHVELCALSELRKKPGLGVPLRSGMGGHSILYLHGVCRDLTAGYPVLKFCEFGDRSVGLSVNSHYRNANWVAADGPDFLWRGALQPGEALTRAAYARTQEHAKAMGFLDGVEFHRRFFQGKPAGMSERDYMYEISVATDYAVRFGRDAYRARVPLDRERMGRIIGYLNDLNAPYREGKKDFNWRVLNNNCSHVAHNALAQAGIWAEWKTGIFFVLAAFNFPVPKNEFVDLVERVNDLPVGDVRAMYEDEVVRRCLLETGALPAAPGALASAEPAIAENEVYDIAGLRLIFYDNPYWGPYRGRLKRILTEPRFLDLRENLSHFETLYAGAQSGRRVARVSAAEQNFAKLYNACIARGAARVAEMLARLDDIQQARVETAS
jgi:hypothetical protein